MARIALIPFLHRCTIGVVGLATLQQSSNGLSVWLGDGVIGSLAAA